MIQQRMQGKMSVNLNATILVSVVCHKERLSFVTKNDSRTGFSHYKLVKDSNKELFN